MNLVIKIADKKRSVLVFVGVCFAINLLVINSYYERIKKAMDNNFVFIHNYPIKLERTVKK